jgi:indole-3-glycerol phosphate synthase
MTTGRTILDDIIAHKRAELEAVRARVPQARLRELAEARAVYYDFENAVGTPNPLGINVIAEVKKASPSRGVLREAFDPVEIAQTYEAAGADAISVLTDEKHFQGSLEHLVRIRGSGVGLPLLRKDFTVSEYHVYEAAAAGADAVLLIAAVLGRDEIKALADVAHALRLAAVVEVYSEAELQTALETPCRIVQINNRDLRTFQVDLDVTRRLAPMVADDRIVISASGFESAEAVAAAREAGAHAVLVGEALMRATDARTKIEELRGAS